MHVNNEQSVIPYAVTGRHKACIRYPDIRGCPHPIDGKLPPKESGADPFTGVGPYYFLHVKTFFRRQRLPNRFPIYVFIGIQTHYNSISGRTPCFQQLNQIVPELNTRAGPVVLLMHNKKSALLLVAGPAIHISICARVVPADYSGLDPLPL